MSNEKEIVVEYYYSDYGVDVNAGMFLAREVEAKCKHGIILMHGNDLTAPVTSKDTNRMSALYQVLSNRKLNGDTTLYLTFQPDLDMAKLIVDSGVSRVVYRRRQIPSDGVTWLLNNFVTMLQYPDRLNF